jgi:hypothetical protein
VGLKVDAKVEAKAPVFVGGPGQYSVLFNGPAMKVICMGFDTATADYLFMKLIQYFAYHDDHDTPMPNILPMVETMTDIDPRFTYAYQFAWTAIMDFDVRPWEERIREGGYIYAKVGEIILTRGESRKTSHSITSSTRAISRRQQTCMIWRSS